MMGRQAGDQSQLFYLFNLESRIPERHLLRRINPIVARVLADVRTKLEPFYSAIGRPSIDPELMILIWPGPATMLAMIRDAFTAIWLAVAAVGAAELIMWAWALL